jgi:hypothetical protein
MAHLPEGLEFRETEMGSGAVEGTGAIKLGNGKCYTCLREARKARNA